MSDTFQEPLCSTCAARLQSVLDSLESDQLGGFETSKKCGSYKKGESIFEENDPPEGVFCMHSGKVKVFKTGDEGKPQIIRFAKPGTILGYRSMLSGEPYTVSATALDESIVCHIPKDTFVAALEKDTQFARRFMEMMSSDLDQAETQIVHLAQKPVRERLAEALLVLKKIYGTENGDTSPLDVTLTREELAGVVGTAVETLVRTLSDLKRERLIATDKKKIRILDTEGLIRVGNLQD
ncbi:MAG: Crp/Fnr family transcriptional regulator [bacterium]|nr:Crp/Fnr family transcriptional regulator [bacterium]